MKFNLKSVLFNTALYGGAALIALVVISLVIVGDKYFKRKAMEHQAELVRNAEAVILDAEQRLDSGRSVESSLYRLNNLDESVLSNDQLRRKLLALGDIYLGSSKREEDEQNRETLYDLATSSYNRALAYCKSSGRESERNELLRRLAEIYADNKDYKKALELINSAKELQSLPADRWRFRLIEAKCLLKDGKPYAAANILASVADECEDNDILSEALLLRAQTLVSAAEDPEILKKYVSKDGAQKSPLAPSPADLERARNDLIALATGIYDKVLTKSNSFDQASAEAKLGLLRISIMRGDMQRAYELVNMIRASPAGMRAKAEAMVLLAEFHEKLKEYRPAIKILESCAQEYPLSSMYVKVSLDLYEYYKKSDDWEKAFTTAEHIIMRNTESTDELKHIIDDLLPAKSDLLDRIRTSDAKEQYLTRLQIMMDKVKTARPEAWRTLQNRANLVLCEAFFISGKYKQAEDFVTEALKVPMPPKEIGDELRYLDLACAQKLEEPPAVVVVRARRYLNFFPAGKHYQDALNALLDSYFEMGLYDNALSVARKIYMDELSRRSAGSPPSKYWLKTVAKIGECYAKLGNFDRANMVLRDNSKALLKADNPGQAFKIWSGIASKQGQLFEAMRRLDSAIPSVKDSAEKADLIVARYLLQLQTGNDKDFNATRELLERISSSDKIPEDVKQNLRRALYKGLLEYAFKSKPDAVNDLLDEILKNFGNESWTQYWVLLSLSRSNGDEALDTLRRKYEKALSDGTVFNSNEAKPTVEFITRQLDLINGLLSINADLEKFKGERKL